jgi:signal transduction histidine kinase
MTEGGGPPTVEGMMDLAPVEHRPWFPTRSPLVGRLAVPLAVAAVEIVGTMFAADNQPGAEPIDALAVLLLAAGPAALVVRDRFPGSVLVIASVTKLAYWSIDYPGGPIFLAMIVALFGAVMNGRRLVAWLTLGFGWAGFLWVPFWFGSEPRPEIGAILGLAAWLLVLGGLAEARRVRRDRAIESAHARAEESRRRASEDRLRIARELHDVLAHNISLINVQAGVALHLIDERPEQARTALAAIKQASKDTLGELRSVLDILRNPGEASPREPAGGLERLEELVSGASATGLTVRTEIEGTRRPLPARVDLTAYRIVQEALTNVIRHARATTATVGITYGDRVLELRVEDDGRGRGGGDGEGTGSGIAGMRDRAAAIDGDLEVGPRAEGGFRVLARLPLDGEP